MRISDWSSDVCSSDLKGVKPGRIVRRHILRNILIPVVTVIGMEFGTLIAYSTITETVFSWPGMGKLLIDSVYKLDRPVIVAYVMLVTLLFVIINLVVDLLYAVLDTDRKSTRMKSSHQCDTRLRFYDL